jgi:uncharacterized membrane protein YphA (DoxX/SURF4 family)
MFGGAPVVIKLNGWLEVILGLLLLLGIWVRPVALVLALNLFSIASTFGLAPTGVRDFGLAITTFSIFLRGSDMWSLGRRLKMRSQPEAAAQ